MLDTLNGYEDAVDSGDTAAATAIIDEMLTAGAQPVTVLTDVIAAAQRAVGARWQRGEWTVAHTTDHYRPLRPQQLAAPRHGDS